MKSKILSLLIASSLISLPAFAGKTLGDIEKEFEGNAKCLNVVRQIGDQYKTYQDLDINWGQIFNFKDQQEDAEASKIVHVFDEFLGVRVNELFQLKAASGKKNDAEYERLADECKFAEEFRDALGSTYSDAFIAALNS